MSDFFWLSEAQLFRIKPYFPRSHGVQPLSSLLKGGCSPRYWPHQRWAELEIARGLRR